MDSPEAGSAQLTSEAGAVGGAEPSISGAGDEVVEFADDAADGAAGGDAPLDTSGGGAPAEPPLAQVRPIASAQGAAAPQATADPYAFLDEEPQQAASGAPGGPDLDTLAGALTERIVNQLQARGWSPPGGGTQAAPPPAPQPTSPARPGVEAERDLELPPELANDPLAQFLTQRIDRAVGGIRQHLAPIAESARAQAARSEQDQIVQADAAWREAVQKSPVYLQAETEQSRAKYVQKSTRLLRAADADVMQRFGRHLTPIEARQVVAEDDEPAITAMRRVRRDMLNRTKAAAPPPVAGHGPAGTASPGEARSRASGGGAPPARPRSVTGGPLPRTTEDWRSKFLTQAARARAQGGRRE